MLRSFFISLSKTKWAQNTITRIPFAWKMASRFVAGESSNEAIEAVRELNQKGIHATLDYLGENTHSAEEARQSTEQILKVLNEIQSSKVNSNVSIKLSQIGLTIDENICRQNLEEILKRAQTYSNFVRIDMEDSSVTDQTIAMLLWALDKGFFNTGIVLQAYLYRTKKDLMELTSRGIRIRLCKGAYNEPSSVAYPKMADVNTNYDTLSYLLLQAAQNPEFPKLSEDGRIPPLAAIASHDPHRITSARKWIKDLQLPQNAIEFQMLYGIRRDLQTALVSEGYPVRVYVPYGTHWYPYFMRRLAERPANVWFFISNFLKK